MSRNLFIVSGVVLLLIVASTIAIREETKSDATTTTAVAAAVSAAKRCVPKPTKVLKRKIPWKPGYPQKTQFLDGGAYRVTRCLPSGRPAISVTAAPIVLPNGKAVYVPTEILSRYGTKAVFRAYGDKSDPRWLNRFEKVLPKLTQEVLPPAGGLDQAQVGQSAAASAKARISHDSSCSDSKYNLFGPGWVLKSRDVGYYVNIGSLPGGNRTKDNIVGAHDAWTNTLNSCGFHPQPTLKMTMVGDTTRRAAYEADGYNVFDFGDTSEIEGCGDVSTIACAIVTSSAEDGITEMDVRFADDLDWSNFGSKNAYDIRSNATHEVGHTLGLADTYGADHAFGTMYAYGGVGQTRSRTLGRGDILGMRALYPPLNK